MICEDIWYVPYELFTFINSRLTFARWNLRNVILTGRGETRPHGKKQRPKCKILIRMWNNSISTLLQSCRPHNCIRLTRPVLILRFFGASLRRT
jgi:hypothetical protein